MIRLNCFYFNRLYRKFVSSLFLPFAMIIFVDYFEENIFTCSIRIEIIAQTTLFILFIYYFHILQFTLLLCPSQTGPSCSLNILSRHLFL